MIRIATRRSRLALWQAQLVAELLHAAGIESRLVPMVTEGDRILDRTLARVGGKGLFIKELEQAMLEGRADIAVHSMKDVPAHIPDGFRLAAVLQPASPLDALVSGRHERFDALPAGARIGTSSLRRSSQLRHRRPDLTIVELRGNVDTRLARLDDGELDAIVLACAGLERLGLASRIREPLDPTLCLPAIGQGVIGIECLSSDEAVSARLAPLHHAPTARRLAAERALGLALEGDCSSPIAAYARAAGAAGLRLTARVAAPDGSRLLHAEAEAPAHEAEALGRRVADELRAQGAGELLASLHHGA